MTRVFQQDHLTIHAKLEHYVIVNYTITYVYLPKAVKGKRSV